MKQSEIKTKIIYLIGPIGNGHTQSDAKMLANVEQSYPIVKELMLKGWTVISPMLSFFMWKYWRDNENFNMPWEKLMQSDKRYVEIADALFRLTEDKYGVSKGADIEEEHAKRINKRVFHNLGEVPHIDSEGNLEQ